MVLQLSKKVVDGVVDKSVENRQNPRQYWVWLGCLFFRQWLFLGTGIGIFGMIGLSGEVMAAPATKQPAPIPPTEHFVILKAVQPEKLLTPLAWEVAQKLIKTRRCPAGEHITGYRTNKVGKKTLVLTIPCESLQKSTGQYPLTLVIQGDRVMEVNYTPMRFYTTRGISPTSPIWMPMICRSFGFGAMCVNAVVMASPEGVVVMEA